MNISDNRALDLIQSAIETEKMDARAAGTIGFLPRILVQTNLPYRDPKAKVYERKNGNVTLTLLSPNGVPYGSIPRYLISYIATKAVIDQSPVIHLGRSQNELVRNLGMATAGGDQKKRLYNQCIKLFTTIMSIDAKQQDTRAMKNVLVASQAYMAWSPKSDPNQISLWQSTLTLTDEFLRECIENPVPVDMRIMDALSSSPMAMDVYSWLTYRVAICRKPSTIPWEYLQTQFGSQATRLAHFRQDFERALKMVESQWAPSIAVDAKDGITIYQGKPSVPKLVYKSRNSLRRG